MLLSGYDGLKFGYYPDFPVARALTNGQDDAAAKRFLRAEKAKTEDEEERGVSISSNWVTKLQNVFKTGAASKLTKQAGTVATKLTPEQVVRGNVCEATNVSGRCLHRPEA
ncbi:uncharacterized protein KRP23_12664 [Phytophthora ramorum]|uniref:uncharacterized protein n=1 Tax=Phytophthora ramorum TaxID=164328 RepID=UPI0030A34158|nr:hypothetical protein KRP23_12664 [Phytophthora ramorum]